MKDFEKIKGFCDKNKAKLSLYYERIDFGDEYVDEFRAFITINDTTVNCARAFSIDNTFNMLSENQDKFCGGKYDIR